MTTAAQTVTRNAPETDSRKTQVTVSRAIHVLSTEDQPRQVVSQRDRTCRNLEREEKPAFGLLLRTWQPYESPLRSWRVFVPNAVFPPGKTLDFTKTAGFAWKSAPEFEHFACFDCFVYCLCFDNNLLLCGRRFMVTELA